MPGHAKTARRPAERRFRRSRASTSSAASGARFCTSARRNRCARACAATSRRAGHALHDRAAAGAGRRHRGDRHGHRGRGASPGAEPRQTASAAVQRAASGRQVVPVHRGHGRGRLPARDVHARAAPAGGRLLRPVREREEGARDAGRAQPGLPVPALRGAEAGPPLRDPLPRLPHRALPGPVRGLHLEGGLPRDHRQRDRVPLGRHEADSARARAEDEGRRRGRALRGGGAQPEPSLRRPPSRRATGCGQALRRQRRRDRDRRRRRPRDGSGLSAARRPADRPLRVPPRERRRTGHGDAAGGIPDRVLRLGAEHAAADRRAAGLRRHVGAGGVPLGAAGLARRGARAGARREAAAPGARDAERATCARVGGAAGRAQAACGGWRRSRSCARP